MLAHLSGGPWMALDHSKLSLSAGSHATQFLRQTLGEGVISTRHLQAMRGGSTVDLAGLVVCRQQPLTARGIVFLLLEDEFGMTDVLVSRETPGAAARSRAARSVRPRDRHCRTARR
jgi:error-prone DNA polymerase